MHLSFVEAFVIVLFCFFFFPRWTWLYTGKENKDVAVGRREERTPVCSKQQTDDNCRVCCGMVILKSNYNACFKSRYIDHIHSLLLIVPNGPEVNLTKLLQV